MLNITVTCPLTIGIFPENDIVSFIIMHTYISLCGSNINRQYNRVELTEGLSWPKHLYVVSSFICQMMSTYFCLLISDELYAIWGICEFFSYVSNFLVPTLVRDLGDCSFTSKTLLVCHSLIRESSEGRAGTLFHWSSIWAGSGSRRMD